VWGGTITGSSTTYDWPFNIVRAFRLSANGQSNLINMRGLTVRTLEFISNAKIDDQGISKTLNGTASTFGTLALSCDDWGTSGANSLGRTPPFRPSAPTRSTSRTSCLCAATT
jgi:hypothetical protein